MEARLFEIIYYVGLPLFASWAFLKVVGKSIGYIGIFAMILGFIMLLSSGIFYVVYNDLFVFKLGSVCFVLGSFAYILGGMLIISDPENQSKSVLDNFIEKMNEKMLDKRYNKDDP